MSIQKEMASVLMEKSTAKQALEQFKSGKEITPIDAHGMNFRLFKTKSNTINLELFMRDDSGMYFKPIGFFIKEDGGWFSSGNAVPTVLKEFESYAKAIDSNVKTLSLLENATVAAFSRETVNMAKFMHQEYKNNPPSAALGLGGLVRFDKNLESNGLALELMFCNQGYPQAYLEDQYGYSNPIGAYIMRPGSFDLHPMQTNKAEYDKLYRMSLLSTFDH